MTIYMAFGANQSNEKLSKKLGYPASAKDCFNAALKWLKIHNVETMAVSGLWQSPAWPAGHGQPDYTNACAHIHSDLPALKLLELLHECEAEFGRVRSSPNASRSIDLDLLDCRAEISKDPLCTLPHPRMLQRSFVLFPLAEIAPNWRDPILNRSIDDWIARLPLSDIMSLSRISAAGKSLKNRV